MTTEPRSTTGATYVDPSVEKPLESGQRVGSLFDRNLSSEYVLQRLTERTYWVQRYFYGTTFYVGDEGVLLFDPLEDRGAAIQEAIASVTDKPVTTLVYSHDHADHIADAGVFEGAQIVASAATAEKMEYLGSGLTRPTQVIDWPTSSFTFEDLSVELHGFTRAAHADDHSAWLLTGERVLHSPDLINCDQPPFWHFAGSENFVYLPGNLRDIQGLEWDWLNGGHGNVGERSDVEWTLGALEDFKKAAADSMAANDFGNFIDPSSTNAHTTFMTNWITKCAADAVDALTPKYGDYYGFTAGGQSNLEMVVHTLLSYR